MKQRTRNVLIIIGLLVVLALCIVTALGIRGMVLRLRSGGSLFSFPTTAVNPLAATEIIVRGTAVVAPPEGSTSALPTAAPVSLLENPCYSPLVPLLPEASWTYDVTARGTHYRIRMSVAPGEGSGSQFDLSALPAGFTVHSVVDCDLGTLNNLPLSTTGMQVEDILKGALSLEYVSGELSPTFDQFEAAGWNLTWSGSYLVSGTSTLRFQEHDYSLSMDQAPLTITCRTVGSGLQAFEPITVAAGTFDALRVSCSLEAPATVALNSWSVSGEVTAQFTEWYSPYLGLVKLQPDSIYVTSPLVSFPVSVSMSGVELVEFTPGQANQGANDVP